MREPLRSSQNKEKWEQLCPEGLLISWAGLPLCCHFLCHKVGGSQMLRDAPMEEEIFCPSFSAEKTQWLCHLCLSLE